MIVSASVRTDVPAFYGEWFRNRFRAGFARVTNPYGGTDYTVPLRNGVDGFVFWTRNAEPFLPMLGEVAEASFPLMVQYTLTGYPRALEASTVEPARAVATMREIARRFGPRAVVWRYDPIVVSDLTQPEAHLRGFARLARSLEGVTDEVVVSFVQSYKKTARNMAAATRAHHFGWRDPKFEEKRQALQSLAAVATRHGMRLTLCSQPELLTDGIEPARCIDAARLGVKAKTKGTRPGCLCAEARDIGAYDSCPHGCVYCYAVGSRTQAKAAYRGHDPDSEYLLPHR